MKRITAYIKPLFLVCAKFISLLLIASFTSHAAKADSINTPNFTMNVDTNRSVGAGAGNLFVTVNTITVAETVASEYSSGSGKGITLRVRPGYQFDPSSNITALSATVGLNGAAQNVTASVTPSGAANETITFAFTSGTSSAQDIIRINGIKLRIIDATGAAGPSRATIEITTTTAGGAFTNQGVASASITKGAAARLIFSSQPGNAIAAGDLLPAVKIVDFGKNIITNDLRTITLGLEIAPDGAILLGQTQHDTVNGIATWVAADDLRITTAATGYTLQASHSGTDFLISDTVSSLPFNISGGNPGSLSFSTQPSETAAGEPILVSVSLLDEFGNATTTSGVDITLDSAINPGGWPLLVDTSLTKSTVNGVASWTADDNLRITKATTGYKLSASGIGSPIVSGAFDIIPSTPLLLRYVQQPSNVKEDAVFSPAVSVEVTDVFGNRTSSNVAISLDPDTAACRDGLKGQQAAAISGLATFDTLSLGTPCSDVSLLATSNGLVGASSDLITVRAKNEVPIAIKNAQIKRGKLFKFATTGTFTPPTLAIDDPTKNGALLTVTGSTGTARYSLPKSGWKKLGNKGFQFSGTKCSEVTVTTKSIKAVCESKTGSLKLPESSVDIVLALGKGSASFCGNCGGNSSANESKIFKRSDCTAPENCP